MALNMGILMVLKSSREADVVVCVLAHSLHRWKMANHFPAMRAYCRLSRFRFRYNVAGSIPKVFAAASRLDALPKMLRI